MSNTVVPTTVKGKTFRAVATEGCTYSTGNRNHYQLQWDPAPQRKVFVSRRKQWVVFSRWRGGRSLVHKYRIVRKDVTIKDVSHGLYSREKSEIGCKRFRKGRRVGQKQSSHLNYPKNKEWSDESVEKGGTGSAVDEFLDRLCCRGSFYTVRNAESTRNRFRSFVWVLGDISEVRLEGVPMRTGLGF